VAGHFAYYAVPTRHGQGRAVADSAEEALVSAKIRPTSAAPKVCPTRMFPETDEMSNILSDTLRVLFKRRLVDRVLRLWIEMAGGGRFPRRDPQSLLGNET
jgi:hypothetical protein